MNEARHGVMTSIGLLILRVGTGVYMATHGWPKVQQVLKRDWENFPDLIGIGKAPSLVLAAGAEFVCALLVAIGLLTRFAAVPVVITMAVAAFMVHGADPWTTTEAFDLFVKKQKEFPSSKEPALQYLIVFLALVFTGPGRFSLDALIFGRRSGRAESAPAV